MIVPMKSSILRKVGIWALVALILLMLGLIITVAVQNHKLEKAKQELVETHKQELEDIKKGHRSQISTLKEKQDDQDLIISSERESKQELELALRKLKKQIQKSDAEIDHMDSTALLSELKGIRAAYQIH